VEQIKFFLSGDVMTGRGIDQILSHPSDPELHEDYIQNAIDYVKLAERRSGSIPTKVPPGYIWGDALKKLKQASLDFRMINLETSITTSSQWISKGINYRMHPENIHCLKIAGIDACMLANNHVLDWGESGLFETLAFLNHAGIHPVGAGRDLREARAPFIFQKPGSTKRVLVFSIGTLDSGIPSLWKAQEQSAGVNFIKDLSDSSIHLIQEMIGRYKKPGDLILLSIHWGDNWSYSIPEDQRNFARTLIDREFADLIYGHSSHHVKGIEVYQGKLILYGCGDLLTDYEGISGYEDYHGDLSLLYFVNLDLESGRLLKLEMIPMQTRKFQLHQTSPHLLAEILNREGLRFRTNVRINEAEHLELIWR
jgi:poly-gamma-glutamate synthesis protein (capsule biosynthesis protein)